MNSHLAVRLQLYALAYNLANFLRTLALPAEVALWSMTTLRECSAKIGARIVRHDRSVIFQMADVIVALFQRILAGHRGAPPVAAGPMLRGFSRLRLPGYRQETCV